MSEQGRAERREYRRLDYRPYPYEIPETRLDFDIRDGVTTVASDLTVERRGDDADLVLYGAELDLVSIAIDGRELGGNEYRVEGETLTVFDVPDRFSLAVTTRIAPERNTALEGLYRSKSMYCTQCEAEGFRKITWFPDRPDVLSRYTTTITADEERCPVLLAGGNLIAESRAGGRRSVTWRDPFPKPSYLFALVAGDLALLEDTFVTGSGREVALRIYSEPHNIGQCGYAMGALKRAMRWDEERFGREYDLDNFMIVAVEDFNMGAMENKGLNIFNTSCVLATPDTATDAAHQRVEGVVAHEYFHNWSGNRVTCRDWFQLSLKEGFTVFRDAEFSADMNFRSVKRVQDVRLLRESQFPEDAGPLAHPVRPESYVEISNFYTRTVYEKGAEVVRMMATVLGAERFRAGCDLYFDRHDGQAVTIEDFVGAMEAASGIDLGQFRRWYSQAGTPVLSVEERREGGRLELTVEQTCPATPGQPTKEPYHMPLAIGLVEDGADLLGSQSAVDVDTEASVEAVDGGVIAHMRTRRLRIGFDAPDADVSFLRGFSAPVRVDYRRSRETLARLAAGDSDGFARWDAAQTLYAECILDAARTDAPPQTAVAAGLFERLWRQGMEAEDGESRALLAAAMTLPTTEALLESVPGQDILAIADARDALLDAIADSVDWTRLAGTLGDAAAYRPAPADMARRELRAVATSYAARRLDRVDPPRAASMLAAVLANADNLTDRLTGFRGLLSLGSLSAQAKQRSVDDFHAAWSHEALVVDAWFTAQATSPRWGDLDRVRRLEGHGAYDGRNPNKVMALCLRFATGNARGFHAAGGEAYQWLAERVAALDPVNPQLASRLAKVLSTWRTFDPGRARLMRDALDGIGREGLSADVGEVLDKALA